MRGEFGPRRVSKEELYVSFADGWRLDSIDEARMIVTFAPDGAFGWRTVLTRVNWWSGWMPHNARPPVTGWLTLTVVLRECGRTALCGDPWRFFGRAWLVGRRDADRRIGV